MAAGDGQLRRLGNDGDISRAVVSRNNFAAAGNDGRIGERRSCIARHINRHVDERITTVRRCSVRNRSSHRSRYDRRDRGQCVIAGTGQSYECASPTRAADVCCSQAGRQSVGDGDRATGGDHAAVADIQAVNGPGLSLREVAGVKLIDEQVGDLSDGRDIARAVVVGIGFAAPETLALLVMEEREVFATLTVTVIT